MPDSEKMSEGQSAGNSAGTNGSAGAGGGEADGAGGGGAGDGAVARPKKPARRKSAPAPRKGVRTRARRRSRPLPPYNVILLDDNHHTVEYVVEMMKKVFGHPEERGVQLAREVDSSGRVIVLTTHREHAELKQDQIHSFGADWRLENSKGSMTAVIEPAKA